jgi:hypothetical protein
MGERISSLVFGQWEENNEGGRRRGERWQIDADGAGFKADDFFCNVCQGNDAVLGSRNANSLAASGLGRNCGHVECRCLCGTTVGEILAGLELEELKIASCVPVSISVSLSFPSPRFPFLMSPSVPLSYSALVRICSFVFFLADSFEEIHDLEVGGI